MRVSNNLVGLLNFITFLLSVPILGGGIWLAHRATTDCEKYLERPVIALGVFLMLISLAGLIGACCRVNWLLWLYLLVMFILILILFCFTIFAFVVTNKGAGEALSGKGYKDYKLGDYSDWLQKRVNNNKNWNRIRSCLIDGKVCESLSKENSTTQSQFFAKHLSPIQDAASHQTAVASSTRGRSLGPSHKPRLPLPAQTVMPGATIPASFATTVIHARLVCCKTSRATGRRWLFSTSSSSSSSSLFILSVAALSGTTGVIIEKDEKICKYRQKKSTGDASHNKPDEKSSKPQPATWHGHNQLLGTPWAYHLARPGRTTWHDRATWHSVTVLCGAVCFVEFSRFCLAESWHGAPVPPGTTVPL